MTWTLIYLLQYPQISSSLLLRGWQTGLGKFCSIIWEFFSLDHWWNVAVSWQQSLLASAIISGKGCLVDFSPQRVCLSFRLQGWLFHLTALEGKLKHLSINYREEAINMNSVAYSRVLEKRWRGRTSGRRRWKTRPWSGAKLHRASFVCRCD